MGCTARIAYTVRIREEQTVQLRHEKKRLALTNEGSVRTAVYQRIDTCRGTAFAGFNRQNSKEQGRYWAVVSGVAHQGGGREGI